MRVDRKQLSNQFRQRAPVLVELARIRHWRQEGFLRPWVAELAGVPRDRQLLREARGERDVCWLEPEDEATPLVTVRIATRDRPEALMDRAVASARRQTYERLEILIVGDNCDERTERALHGCTDPRVRFVNLPRAGRYPSEPIRRWRVAGSKPMNAALELAAGDWIAPCDDDDELTDDHVERLLTHARRRRLEFVWSRSELFPADGSAPRVTGSPRFGRGAMTHGSVLYSMGLDFLRYSITSDRLREPADWNLFRRMRLAGVRMGFVDSVTYRYWEAGPGQYGPATPTGPHGNPTASSPAEPARRPSA
jgi:hypothetical protein